MQQMVGILSPQLFSAYKNELNLKLSSQFIGCHISSICYNHLIYADDTILSAPLPKALQMIIDICVAFGIENTVYNEEWTKCMCIKHSVMIDLYVPAFHLGHPKVNVKITLFKKYC